MLISFFSGLRVIRPGVPIFDQDRQLSKSATGNSDKKLPPYRAPELCFKFQAQCNEMYDVLKAKRYGLNYGQISY